MSPLSTWHNTPTRQSILDFVAAVTAVNTPTYVPPQERIATFDNDGTLWCERPFYIQFAGALDFLADLAEADPGLQNKQPFKAAYENDKEWFAAYTSNEKIPELVGMLLKAAAGETQDEFEARALQWLENARHPRFDRLYTELIYKSLSFWIICESMIFVCLSVQGVVWIMSVWFLNSCMVFRAKM